MEIRIRYSGLVIFSSKVVSVGAGIVFILLLTHSLSTSEFGVWSNLSIMIASFGIASSVFPYWAARYTARHFGGALKLGLIANLILSIPVLIIALIIGPILASAANTSGLFYLYAGILIVQSYIISALEGVVSVVKTQVIGYAFLGYEVVKVSIALILVLIFHFAIIGALTASFVANWAWIAFYTLSLRRQWAEKINYGYAKQWLKGSFLNFYGVGAGLVASLEGYVLLFRGGSLPVAYYGAALTMANPIGLTTSLYAALYPKLLSGGTPEDVNIAWKTSLLFSVPLTLAVVVLSPSLLAILGPNYTISYIVLSLLALRSFGYAVQGVLDAVIGGTERLDAMGSISMSEAFRSRLFRSLTIPYLIYPIYIPILWVILGSYQNNPIAAAEITAFLGVIVTIGLNLLKYILASKAMSVAFPLGSALKYTLVSILVVTPAFFISQPTSPTLAIVAFFAGTSLYFIIIYFVEDDARSLIIGALAFVRRILKFRV